MDTLSDDEIQRLIEIAEEEYGDGLSYDDFAEVIHGFFEDIPGLETIEPADAGHLINLIWRKYHGENHVQET